MTNLRKYRRCRCAISVAIALLIFGITIANGGGLTQKVSQPVHCRSTAVPAADPSTGQNLGLRDGVI